MDVIAKRVIAARSGNNPFVIGRMKSGWLVLGETQPLPGYCQLLADPIVSSLNDLQGEARAQYLLDMAAAGDALLAVTGASRINYETWCNLAPSLHTHIVPRYVSEEEDKRIKAASIAYDYAAARPFSLEQDKAFMDAMRQELGLKA
ncbi:hypothetical protein QMA67_04075 [Gluconobacter japonicus]|uniref:HIT domain-containing protein n=1 Tax=Gluconobacter japonicus TaxID=376620 RepID=A0A9Q2ISJ1_GLUJA|nr:hypothetical protein [Gluconobacter japonicus]GAP23239.1 hypothetical protein GLF_0121 [Gluconobacter frateurii NBRC 101659]KXV26478.1 hypothetical protein AD937_06885 [Gluconobacter japonicus]KXV40086.1 hypothetical protein AD942_07385 [Gluconobacter japonicus]MBF0870014.1 hypothetical protein [Gluconobacter japonicus]MDI6652123.1 hypothetical protein [Gluconobacter japonicus]